MGASCLLLGELPLGDSRVVHLVTYLCTWRRLLGEAQAWFGARHAAVVRVAALVARSLLDVKGTQLAIVVGLAPSLLTEPAEEWWSSRRA